MFEVDVARLVEAGPCGEPVRPQPGGSDAHQRLSGRRLGGVGLTVLFVLFAITRCLVALQARQDGGWHRVASNGAMMIALVVSSIVPLRRTAPIATRTAWRPRTIAAIGAFAIWPLLAFPLTWVLRPVFSAYDDYAARVPAFLPRFGERGTAVERTSRETGFEVERPEDALAA